jgi:poly-gamma-glutamate synthesis protein (capsule biosynthesis protein)
VQCPTQRQQRLAADLAEAGASVVVGSHAHVLEPAGTVDGAFVAYGLGNFHFYAKPGNTLGTQTGVMTVEVGHDGVVGSEWHPATIRDGRPELLTAEQLEGSSRGPEELSELGERCAAGAVATPSPEVAAPGADEADGGDDGSAGAGSPGGGQSPTGAPTGAPTDAPPSAEPSASAAPSSAAPTATAGGGAPAPSAAPA